MSLATIMRNNGESQFEYKKVGLDQIRVSEKNFYRVMDSTDFEKKMIALAWDIKDKGKMIYPITVKPLDDGKYELIDGETRYSAMSYLYENGFGDGTIRVQIENEIMDEMTEVKVRIGSNIQRTKKNTQIQTEIKMAQKEYREMVENGEKPKSMVQFTEDGQPIELSENQYVMERLGIAERTLRKHKERIRQAEESMTETTETQNEVTVQDQVQKLKTKIKNDIKNNNNHKSIFNDLYSSEREIVSKFDKIDELYNEILQFVESE